MVPLVEATMARCDIGGDGGVEHVLRARHVQLVELLGIFRLARDLAGAVEDAVEFRRPERPIEARPIEHVAFDLADALGKSPEGLRNEDDHLVVALLQRGNENDARENPCAPVTR